MKQMKSMIKVFLAFCLLLLHFQIGAFATADDSIINYEDPPIVSGNGDITYDVAAAAVATVHFNGNGHTGGTLPASRTVPLNTPHALPGLNSITRTGYSLVGWRSSVSGNVFAPGWNVVFTGAGTWTYTAVWARNNWWPSDSDFVHFWPGSPRVRVESVQWANQRARVEGDAATAVADWQSVGLPSTFVSGMGTGDSDIQIRMGTYSWIYERHGTVLLGHNANGYYLYGGFARHFGLNTIANPTVASRVRTVTGVRESRIYVADRRTAGTFTFHSSRLNRNVSLSYAARGAVWDTNLMRHELGHSLGFRGHTSNNQCLMWTSVSQTTHQRPTLTLASHILRFRNRPQNNWAFSSPLFDDQRINLLSSSSEFPETLSSGEIAESMIQSEFNSNIIIGEAVELLHSDEAVGVVDGADAKYLFRINENLTGNELPSYITVRSQIGSIFSIGEEYVISPMHLNNTLWDIHIIFGSHQFVRLSALAQRDDQNLRRSTAVEASLRSGTNHVVENASLSSQFIENLDMVVEITVNDKWQDPTAPHIFDVGYTLNNILVGDQYRDLLPERLTINFDAQVGGTYMVLLDVINGEFVLPAARNGAVISTNSPNYERFSNSLASRAH